MGTNSSTGHKYCTKTKFDLWLTFLCFSLKSMGITLEGTFFIKFTLIKSQVNVNSTRLICLFFLTLIMSRSSTSSCTALILSAPVDTHFAPEMLQILTLNINVCKLDILNAVPFLPQQKLHYLLFVGIFLNLHCLSKRYMTCNVYNVEPRDRKSVV